MFHLFFNVSNLSSVCQQKMMKLNITVFVCFVKNRLFVKKRLKVVDLLPHYSSSHQEHYLHAVSVSVICLLT